VLDGLGSEGTCEFSTEGSLVFFCLSLAIPFPLSSAGAVSETLVDLEEIGVGRVVAGPSIL